MFQLTAEEYRNLRYQFGTLSLRSQFVTLKSGCASNGPAETAPEADRLQTVVGVVELTNMV